VIHASASLDAPVPRLLAALGTPKGRDGPDTVVIGPAGTTDVLAEGLDRCPQARLLVMSVLGTHPDARAARLRSLWTLEERARASGRPVLTLRLAPIVGPKSPLWLRLRSRPTLPGRGRPILNPVGEEEVVETLVRAFDGRATWEGWYEVAGPEALTLEELAALAARLPRLPHGAGNWEPPIAEFRDQGLAEPRPWSEHFGVTPRDVSSRAASWS